MLISADQESVAMKVIGIVHSCFSDKFGIPRQSGLAPSARATIEMLEPFNRREMFRKLEGFSHLWLQFLFHEAVVQGWKTTVRPPRLDGKERVGVFATRSPHRPNHVGLSVVRLESLDFSNNTVRLEISGADLLDKTPLIDIKPYLPYSDIVEQTSLGWAAKAEPLLDIVFSTKSERFCRTYEKRTGRNLSGLIREVLCEDPRPASQKEIKEEFGMYLWDVNVRWSVTAGVCLVSECSVD